MVALHPAVTRGAVPAMHIELGGDRLHGRDVHLILDGDRVFHQRPATAGAGGGQGGFDYPILMGVLLVAAVMTVMANLIADIAYAVVDPRIKY